MQMNNKQLEALMLALTLLLTTQALGKSHTAEIQILALPLTCCLNLGKLNLASLYFDFPIFKV